MSAIVYHVHIWQVLAQLSCGDTCQIWMWCKQSNRYLDRIKTFAFGEINERSFSTPGIETFMVLAKFFQNILDPGCYGLNHAPGLNYHLSSSYFHYPKRRSLLFLTWWSNSPHDITSTVYWCIASKLKVPLIFYGMNNTFLCVDFSLFNQSYSGGITTTKKPTGY